MTNRQEQAMVAAGIYAVISVLFSGIAAALAWATYTAPMWQAATPFLGAMLFVTLASASGWAAVHCAKLS